MKKILLSLTALITVALATKAQTGNFGIGTSSPGSKLTVNGSFAATYNNVTATNYSMTAGDYYVAWNGSANGTITLPTALAIGSGNYLGRVYNIKNTGTNTLVLATAAGELMDNQSGAGVPNITLAPGYYAMIISKGTTTGTTWEVALLANNTVPCSGFGTRISGGTQPLAAGTTKLLFPAEEWDQGNVFNPATGTFTVTEAGRYTITGSYKTGAGSAPNSQDLILFKNNTVLAYGTSIGSSTVLNVVGGSISYVANLAAGDVIDLRIFMTSGATSTVDQASFSAIKSDCGSSGGTTPAAYTADNGLTMSANNTQLGGILLHNTDIALSGFNQTFSGAGNVGIGTTSPSFQLHQVGGNFVQDIYGTANWPYFTQRRARGTVAAPAAVQSGDQIGTLYFAGHNGTGFSGFSSIAAFATENFTNTGNGSDLRFYTNPNGGTLGQLRMTIDQGGNVGINTTAAQGRLDVRGDVKVVANPGVQTGQIWNGTSNVNGFEVRTTVGGDVWVGIQRSGTVSPLHLAKPAGTATGEMINFSVGGTGVGTITHTTTSVQYNTTSDVRLKENIRSSGFGLQTLNAIHIYDYNYKADREKKLSTGVLAQELYKVYPQAVTVGGEDAHTTPWQVDYSKLTPVLVQAVQELNQKVVLLEQENARLKEQQQKVADLAAQLKEMQQMLGISTKAAGAKIGRK